MPESDALEMKALLANELRRFHQGSCYPTAMDFEVEIAVNRILKALSSPPPAVGGEVERLIAKAPEFATMLRGHRAYCTARDGRFIEAAQLLDAIAALTPQGGRQP